MARCGTLISDELGFSGVSKIASGAKFIFMGLAQVPSSTRAGGRMVCFVGVGGAAVVRNAIAARATRWAHPVFGRLRVLPRERYYATTSVIRDAVLRPFA